MTQTKCKQKRFVWKVTSCCCFDFVCKQIVYLGSDFGLESFWGAYFLRKLDYTRIKAFCLIWNPQNEKKYLTDSTAVRFSIFVQGSTLVLNRCFTAKNFNNFPSKEIYKSVLIVQKKPRSTGQWEQIALVLSVFHDQSYNLVRYFCSM
jgi:hypothetical protein